MSSAAIAVTVFFALFAGMLFWSLLRTLAHEVSRTPQTATAFQRQYPLDSHQRSQQQLFFKALSAGTVPELVKSLK